MLLLNGRYLINCKGEFEVKNKNTGQFITMTSGTYLFESDEIEVKELKSKLSILEVTKTNIRKL